MGNRRVGGAKRYPSVLPRGHWQRWVRFAHPSYEARILPLPAADAAGLARPGLDPRVARLRVERIAMTSRQLGAGGAARLLGALLRYASLQSRVLGAAAFGTTTRSVFTGLAIGSRLDPDRGEFRLRAEPLRREQRPCERSRPRNSPARYSSASAALPDIRSPVQSAAAIAFFRTIAGLLKSTKKLKIQPSCRKPAGQFQPFPATRLPMSDPGCGKVHSRMNGPYSAACATGWPIAASRRAHSPRNFATLASLMWP